MNHRQLKHITNRHYSELKKHSRKVVEDLDVEAIHQFRVEYKKLRAFLRLLSQANAGAGKIKISKKLKRAYNIAGSIRDLQLQQLRILEGAKNEFRRPQQYISLLQQEIDKLKPPLAEIIREKPIEETKKKTDASVPDKLPAHSYGDFVQQKWGAIQTIIASRQLTDANLHATRKHLKDLLYNLKICQKAEPDILLQKGKGESYFHKLLEELGKFQDLCAALALLKSYPLDGLNDYNRKLLDRVKKDWLKNKRDLKRSLVNKLKTDISLPETV